MIFFFNVNDICEEVLYENKIEKSWLVKKD